MSTAALIVLIIVVVIVVAGIGMLAVRQGQKRRSERLKERFGPEYDRAVEHADDQRAAESELVEREKRHRDFELRDLGPAQRREFEQRWADVQRDFVDGPGRAVSAADRLVVDVMSARGYPVDDFDQRADDLSVRYPEVTTHYREARRVARANERGEATTEDLRGALTSYRSLVEALLGDGRGDEHRGDRDRQPGAEDGDRMRDGELGDRVPEGERGELSDRQRGGARAEVDEQRSEGDRESAGHATATGKTTGQEGGT